MSLFCPIYFVAFSLLVYTAISKREFLPRDFKRCHNTNSSNCQNAWRFQDGSSLTNEANSPVGARLKWMTWFLPGVCPPPLNPTVNNPAFPLFTSYSRVPGVPSQCFIPEVHHTFKFIPISNNSLPHTFIFLYQWGKSQHIIDGSKYVLTDQSGEKIEKIIDNNCN